MTMINPDTGWFEIFEVPCFNLNEVARVNFEYVDKLSARVRHIFNHTWLCRYPRPCKVVADNDSGFKRYLTPLLKYFAITPIYIFIKNPQMNAPVEHIYQVVYNIIVTNDIDRNVYDYIYP